MSSHNNYDRILKFSERFDAAFRSYNKGVFIKDWKASQGFKPLIELLRVFRNIKSFKLGMEWDQEGDITRLIIKSIQYFRNLERLDISNCRLTEANIEDLKESIPHPEKLRALDVSDNALSMNHIKKLGSYFQNLTNLRYSEGGGYKRYTQRFQEI